MALCSILLVDDEVGFVETMEKRLKKRDMNVYTAFSGPDSLKSLKKNSDIEVVVLDVKMPEMDGIETLSRIKNQNPLIEVIMLTGNATVETAIEGMKLGAFDYLMKPCEIEELVKKVIKAADKKAKHEQKILDARMKEITNRIA